MSATEIRTASANAEISRRIVAEMAKGADLATAMDRVLGAGAYAAVVDSAYEALRARK